MEERANKPLGERPAGRGLFIGRLLGIEFYLDYSWFLIAAIVTYQLAQEEFPLVHPGHAPFVYVIMGAVAAILFFLSIILHELGHSVVSQRCGIPVSRITLLFIGGLAEIAREPDDARSELKIALGGPLVSVVLIAVFGALAWFCALTGLGAAQAVCQWLALTNLVLVIFNMIPGYPLDGGRVLRALLWARSGRLRQSTYITSRIGIAFGWFLMAFGTWALLAWHQWNAIVLFLIALFLKSAAENGYTAAIQREVLGGVRVRDVMTPRPTSISATLPLNLAVDDFFLSNHHVAFPVCDTDGDFRGLLRLEFLRDLPREKWPYTTAGDLVAEKGGASLQIESDETAARAMRRLLAPDQGRLAVVEKGKLVGMITRHDILHVIEIHSELEA
jgi:Zn-dependent protease/CBS domain-containing protein